MSGRQEKKAVCLMGPTASGKTAVAVELVKNHPFEIVSVDSAMVFRHLDIGTAKPDAETLGLAPHHLIDLIDPTESYSAGNFRQDALLAMEKIRRRGKVPLLVGGTMLYFKSLMEGLNELPPADPEVRRLLDEKAAKIGWPEMHRELAAVDPETASRLKPADAQRIQRALEVWQLSGRKMSEILREERQQEAGWDFLQIALAPSDRSVLHQRIASRFAAMLEQGLVEELAGLRKKFALSPELPSMRAVGYRQAWSHLDGEIDEKELFDRGVAATRQLAKRQLTWLRSMQGIEFVDSLDPRAYQKTESILMQFDWLKKFC